ncbi:MAG: polysaccharide biosynthesis protein [Firmicutes bacterium]|nr:polysaccharide biosynthesis protein [Bacillota bacterium]
MRVAQRDSFVRGAFILMAAALVTRVIGVFQRLPLYWMIGPEGNGLYTASYDYYAIILGLSTSGINVAIAKQVAERMALGDEAGAHRIFRLSAWLMGTLGLVFSVVFFWASPFLATQGFGNPAAYLSFVAVAPAIFLVSLMAPYRGWFQGLQVMMPVGVSLVVEQLARVAVMLALAYLLLPRGLDWAAAGAATGAAAGAVAGLIYLVYAYSRARRVEKPPDTRPTSGKPEPILNVFRQTLRLAVPVSLASLMFQLFMLVDTNLVLHRLTAAGFQLSAATTAFGQLKGPATTVVNLPTVLTFAIANSLVPAVSEALVLGRKEQIRQHSAAAVRMTLLLTIPALVGLYLLASPIQLLLFRDSGAGAVTRALSGAVIFVPLQMTSSAILQGLGKVTAPVWNLAAGAVVKLILTWVLTANPNLGVSGAAYATAIGFFVAAALNLSLAQWLVGSVFEWMGMVIKPCLASVAMGLAVAGSYGWLYSLWPSNGVATLAAITVGVATYGVALLLLGGINRSDLEVAPGLARIAQRLPFIR